MAKAITSEAYQLIKQDLQRVATNAFIFALPAVAICLEQLIAGKSVQEILPVLSVWLLNTLLDLTRKFMQTARYTA